MNQELEALVLALDAWKSALGGDDAERLQTIFDSRIGDALGRHPKLTREILLRMVELQRRRWLLAQKKTTTLPPKA